MLSSWVPSHVVSQHKHSRLWTEATVLLLAHHSLWVTNLELELACLKIRSSDRDRRLSISWVLQKNPLSLCSSSPSSWHAPFPLHLLFSCIPDFSLQPGHWGRFRLMLCALSQAVILLTVLLPSDVCWGSSSPGTVSLHGSSFTLLW